MSRIVNRTELIRRLRRLQADAYGAMPTAEGIGQQCIEKYDSKHLTASGYLVRHRKRDPEAEERARLCYEHGALEAITRSLALEIDQLIQQLEES